nr:chalcone synthase [Bougainvillea spectabilis]
MNSPSLDEIREANRAKGTATILVIGTAVPPDVMYQSKFPDFYFRVTNNEHLVRSKEKFKRICERTNIRKRHMLVTEEILKKNPNLQEHISPSFNTRQDILETKIVELGKDAAMHALKEWGQSKSAITHLIFCTTACIHMPGADYHLSNLLGLNPNIRRTMFYLQGCFAGGMALRHAKDIVENNKGARVLVVCSETLACAYRGPVEFDDDNLVNMALFGDGAVAAIIGTDLDISIEKALFTIVSASQTFLPDSEWAVTCRLREEGLIIHLNKDIPVIISHYLDKVMVDAFEPLGIHDWNSIFWICHPGGRRILDEIESKLGLNEDKFKVSREILAEYGNIRSCSVLFILDQMRKKSLEERKITTGEGLDWGVLLAFGPGLTIETIVLHSVPL